MRFSGVPLGNCAWQASLVRQPVMGTSQQFSTTLERTGYRVTALVLSRLQGGDIREALDRLEDLPKSQARLRIGAVFAGLLALALIAASFGWIGLGVYFAAILLIFR